MSSNFPNEHAVRCQSATFSVAHQMVLRRLSAELPITQNLGVVRGIVVRSRNTSPR